MMFLNQFLQGWSYWNWAAFLCYRNGNRILRHRLLFDTSFTGLSNIFLILYDFFLKALVNVRIFDILIDLRRRRFDNCSCRLIEATNITTWYQVVLRIAKIIILKGLHYRDSISFIIIQAIIVVVFNLWVIVIALINNIFFFEDFVHLNLLLLLHIKWSIEGIWNLGLHSWTRVEGIFILNDWVMMHFVDLLLFYFLLIWVFACIQKCLIKALLKI